MNSDKDIDCFFIESRQDVTAPYVSDNVLYTCGNEGYAEILDKTLRSIQYFSDRLDDYDYIIRSNLSSLYDFEELKRYVSKSATHGVYAGCIGEYVGIQYVSGSGMIMTPDVVKELIKNKHLVERYGYPSGFVHGNQGYQYVMDDVSIGYILRHSNILPQVAPRRNILSKEYFNENIADIYSPGEFHYRCRFDNDRGEDEIIVKRHILNAIFTNTASSVK
jgi:hypothetical protein